MDRVLILLLPTVLASGTYEYKGFDSCGLGGWSCRNTPQGYEVVYRCSIFDRDARIWMWTARIPGSATTLAIENCNHVEVHPDCTMGYRGYTMRTFRASNIEELEIMRPLSPYVFLHDNDQVPHMPPQVILENIGKFTVFSGAFDKAGRRCRTKQQQLESFTARNVTMYHFLENQFSEQTLQSFELENVQFGSDERMALSVNANVTITDTKFDNVTATGTMTFQGSRVTLKNNHFDEMSAGALKVKCHYFEFEGNNISHLSRASFDILAQNVSIISNTIGKADNDTFARIKPGGGLTKGFEAAKKAVYRLDGNIFQVIGIHSLNPDIEAYNDTCFQFIIKNNQLPCSCPEFRWSVASPPFQFFYDKVSAYENNNTCYQLTPSCNLAQALMFKSNCTFLHMCDSLTTDAATTKAKVTQIFVSTEISPSHTTVASTLKQESASTPSKDSRVSQQQSTNALTIFLGCAAVLTVVGFSSGAAWYYIYKKRKEGEVLGPVYQNQCRSDYDEQNLIDEQ